jgi:hypothetical protein
VLFVVAACVVCGVTNVELFGLLLPFHAPQMLTSGWHALLCCAAQCCGQVNEVHHDANLAIRSWLIQKDALLLLFLCLLSSPH